jgi:OMF family outer membrane factor
LRVEAALAAAEAEKTTTAAELDVAERALARSTGLALEQTRAGNLEDPDLKAVASHRSPELERLALERNPAVMQAKERLASQQANVAFARAGNRPRLQAVGSLLEFGSGSGSFAFEWNTGVQVRWSVFDGGANSARVAQATAAEQRAEQQVRLAEKDARDALDRALADLEQARANEESLRVAVERFQEVVRVERLRLDAGVGIQSDYIRAEADLMQARAGLAAARYRAMAAEVEISRITGRWSHQ